LAQGSHSTITPVKGSMAARAAFVFVLFAIGVIQLLCFSSSRQTPRLYTFGFVPQITSLPRQTTPHMMTVYGATTKATTKPNLHSIGLDEDTKDTILSYLEEGSQLEKTQRGVLVSLFRISKKAASGQRSELPTTDEALADPSGEVAVQAAAYEVFFISRDLFGGPVKDFVDNCMRRVMLTTKDAGKRVEILDTCFQAFPAEYKDTPVEDGMRLFRMLLAPQTANVESAKTEVRARSTKLNRDTAGMVEKWMRKMEVGHPEFLGPTDFAEDCRTVSWDPMDVWMPMMPRKKNSQARSAEDCFLFEESLRNYKAVVVNLEAFDL